MKKLAVAAFALFALSTQAQDKKMARQEFTSEQRATLQVKKMTLDLDLNEKQQKDVKSLLVAQNKKMEEGKAKREAAKAEGKKPTHDEKFAMQSKMMDEKIAFKADMKKILSEKQMEKWEEHQADRKQHMRERRKKMHNKRSE